MKLGVNVDHVATLRQARKGAYPSPLEAAKICELAGADNITCHLREDRRHIQDQDIFEIKKNISIPLNFEMACTDEMQSIALKLMPHTVTLVPERREELTTEGGLDVAAMFSKLKNMTASLKTAGILDVSFFIDPTFEAIDLSLKAGANSIEIHTGTYCEASLSQRAQELTKITEAAAYAQKIGLHVHAGHGLNLLNVEPIAAIPFMQSLQIGHALISEAIFVGLPQAVKNFKKIIG